MTQDHLTSLTPRPRETELVPGFWQLNPWHLKPCCGIFCQCMTCSFWAIVVIILPEGREFELPAKSGVKSYVIPSFSVTKNWVNADWPLARCFASISNTFLSLSNCFTHRLNVVRCILYILETSKSAINWSLLANTFCLFCWNQISRSAREDLVSAAWRLSGPWRIEFLNCQIG